MRIRTPFVIAGGEGLRLPAIGSVGPGVGTNERVLRAVAAAVAIRQPALALRMADEAADEPWDVLDAYSSDAQRRALTRLLDRVAKADDGTAGEPLDAETEQRVVRAARALPSLVRVALEGLDADGAALEPAAAWAAALDRTLLERAGRGAVEATLLLIPDSQAHMETLEERVAAAEQRLEDHGARLAALEKKPDGGGPTAAALSVKSGG